MRYIRTKDGRIIKIGEQTDAGFGKGTLEIHNKTGIAASYEPFEVLKEADTIEELCDEFVYEILTGEDEEPMYRDIHNARIDIKTQLKIYEDDMAGVRAIYGAIWTDKGLIYVAKMNKKGELELL